MLIAADAAEDVVVVRGSQVAGRGGAVERGDVDVRLIVGADGRFLPGV